MSKLELWLGLVELKPIDRKAYGAAGAYTNIVTWASNAQGFREKVEIIAAEIGMYVGEIEDVESVASRSQKSTLTEMIEDMVKRAEPNPDAIIYGTFHTYPFDPA